MIKRKLLLETVKYHNVTIKIHIALIELAIQS